MTAPSSPFGTSFVLYEMPADVEVVSLRKEILALAAQIDALRLEVTALRQALDESSLEQARACGVMTDDVAPAKRV